MIVRHGFAPADRPALARLYWAAFGDKLGRVLGPEDRARTFIAQVASPDHALCIHDGGRLIGVAGFHSRQGALVGGGISELANVYGTFGGIWRGLALGLLERPLAEDELLVDGIFVAETHRGRGVGTTLLEALAREAVARSCARVRLDVINSNPRARALYERRGFTPIAEQSNRLLRPLFGFQTATTMVRRVI
ncbi:GNAT family N-acetyltransferase [Roseisalinus antarcticus]|uniref:Putative acetyltransferase n=1 Tax=Roseisalinus antarcticus TaxID=254357 RepID=A0A1Y5RNF1_9RHOB|nr:GNAT family N-acetyltransferase [Roseisalinus antarcticus]SLN21623.1 putative acetyltransferase [Roseisalinus antarcticus]